MFSTRKPCSRPTRRSSTRRCGRPSGLGDEAEDRALGRIARRAGRLLCPQRGRVPAALAVANREARGWWMTVTVWIGRRRCKGYRQDWVAGTAFAGMRGGSRGSPFQMTPVPEKGAKLKRNPSMVWGGFWAQSSGSKLAVAGGDAGSAPASCNDRHLWL